MQLKILIERTRLPSERYCNATPEGKDWPVCALPLDHATAEKYRPHESASYVWGPYGDMHLKSVDRQREWDQEVHEVPDPGPIIETIANIEFRDEAQIHSVIAEWDGFPVGQIFIPVKERKRS